MSQVDWNDPLLDSKDPETRSTLMPLDMCATDIVKRINAFVLAEDRIPMSRKDANVVERLLSNDLAGLRASREKLDGIKEIDYYGLVFDDLDEDVLFDDPLLESSSSIFSMNSSLNYKSRPDFIARRMMCPDFHRFELMFELIRDAVKKRTIIPRPFRQEKIKQGEILSLKRKLIYIADVRDRHDRNGKADARLRVIYDNATESNLLMSSLIRAMQKDKGSARITMSEEGPLFGSVQTGFIYVVRSLSTNPAVSGFLKVGVTQGSVKDRISGAEKQSTYLYAPVEVLDVYKIIGYSAIDIEEKLHKALMIYRKSIRVTGPTGRRYKPREWFEIDRQRVARVIEEIWGTPSRVVDFS